MTTQAIDQCRYCDSRECYTRVLTRDLLFDEVSCERHLKDLDAAVKRLARGTKVMVYECLTPTRRGEHMDDVFDYLEEDDT